MNNQPLGFTDQLGLQQCATHNGRCVPPLHGGGGGADDRLFDPGSDWNVFTLMTSLAVWVPSGTVTVLGSSSYVPGYYDSSSVELAETAALGADNSGGMFGTGCSWLDPACTFFVGADDAIRYHKPSGVLQAAGALGVGSSLPRRAPFRRPAMRHSAGSARFPAPITMCRSSA